MSTPPPDIRASDLADFMNLFEEFRVPSWDTWRGILARLRVGVRAFFVIAGRGSGKSYISGMLGAFFATREYRRVPGEHIFIAIAAPDRKQAGVTFEYVRGLLKSVHELEEMIVSETANSVELLTGCVLEVITASTAAPRGRSYACVIIEESAFLPTEDSVNPDFELLRAFRPGLARVPGSLLVVVSSPYARRGILWDAHEKHAGKPDTDVVYVQEPTLTLNPAFDAAEVARAYEDDPVAAAAEYGAQFRSDVEALLTVKVLDAAIVKERFALPPDPSAANKGYVDSGGGSGKDRWAAAVAKRDGNLNVLVELFVRDPPYSPQDVAKECAAFFRRHGIASVEGDHYSASWVVDAMRVEGIEYLHSRLTSSEIFAEFVPLANSGSLKLLDHPRLRSELVGLERRTGRTGRDSISHRPGGHDDVALAAAGALVLAAGVGSNAPTIRLVQMRGTQIFLDQPDNGPAHPAFPVNDVNAAYGLTNRELARLRQRGLLREHV
jgi:hypothetical protein